MRLLLALERTAQCTFPSATGAEVLPAQAETWKVIAGLPWVVKPMYGFVSDTVPIFGRRRQPYLVACGLVGERTALCLLIWAGETAMACCPHI